MFHIIITVDYEIFGNGKGNVKRHIIKPAERLINIASKYRVPITIMMETCEYHAFSCFEKDIKNDFGYSPSKLIEKQLRSAYESGHDVQLHIHPQFVDLKYENKRFIVKNQDQRIEDFTNEEITHIFNRGIEHIKNVINDHSHKVLALRLSNMPWDEAPKKVLPIMEKLGLKIHTLALSTHKRNTPYNYWSNGNIYEIPILTYPMPFFKYMTLRRIGILTYLYLHDFSNLKGSSVSIHSKYSVRKKNFDAKWDLSKLNCKAMIQYIERSKQIFDWKNFAIPLVMIGHTKDFFNTRNFDCFLRTAKKRYVDGDIAKFSIFKDFLEEIGDSHESFGSK